jgi:hypothetical protein
VIALDGLRPIALPDLVARAELLTRVDRKYLLPATDLPVLLGGLTDGVEVLEIDGRREFAYRSTYFDTPDLDSYLAAARRRRHRFKVRVRSYLDSDVHFLEVKTRGSRGTTVKDRVPWAGRITGAVLANAGVDVDPAVLRHTLTTRYRRTTLFVPTTGSRVTIDTDLAWELPDGTALRTPDRVVVETKSGRATSTVDRLLWSMDHRPCPVSKYATGLAALRPDLPSHRWHPVLRRHFTPA